MGGSGGGGNVALGGAVVKVLTPSGWVVWSN